MSETSGISSKELLAKLRELETMQWTNRMQSEVWSHIDEFEYKVILKNKEDEYFKVITELTVAGYEIVENGSLIKIDEGIFIMLMRRKLGR